MELERKGRRASASGDWFKTDIPERNTIARKEQMKEKRQQDLGGKQKEEHLQEKSQED